MSYIRHKSFKKTEIKKIGKIEESSSTTSSKFSSTTTI